ncbi:MAG: cob(I)yrinic acid a,c-diamide adenosyltransferase [Gemmatales bacterium]|nr:cob(I)yrinic acid a,c-diamide adenosyltransferase [Gemmatales bacterium]MCS7160246.1 cob(I)yrinic acid a,c-diamide adenosyltransferase [Gemmatales bacterium]MDW8175446.1 cob(I)yrinic acid a,c-diamide adenosyltransferase [Gemmatales bacterium]MDW8222762.1 cob(I)yrinic acid a,c-diamide adenosyltransferase [Gemmatales bacterium]
MVYLSRIYTRTGDQGETSLGDGRRVVKSHPRVEAYGEVDELNSVLGLLLAHAPQQSEAELIRRIQNDLFDVGADLCCPSAEDDRPRLRVQPIQVQWLEEQIDRLNSRLRPLTSFVLPGGGIAGAWCHLARTVCRRAERAVVRLSQQEAINSQVLSYLNRLSDLLFVLARIYNEQEGRDLLWRPGAGQQASGS